MLRLASAVLQRSHDRPRSDLQVPRDRSYAHATVMQSDDFLAIEYAFRTPDGSPRFGPVLTGIL